MEALLGDSMTNCLAIVWTIVPVREAASRSANAALAQMPTTPFPRVRFLTLVEHNFIPKEQLYEAFASEVPPFLFVFPFDRTDVIGSAEHILHLQIMQANDILAKVVHNVYACYFKDVHQTHVYAAIASFDDFRKRDDCM